VGVRVPLRNLYQEAIQMTRKTALPKARRKVARADRRNAHDEKIAAAIAALNDIRPPNPKAAKAIALFRSWLEDESGYDEKTWPRLKKALDQERTRVGARRLFDA
jgi:hypothetical protein